VGLRINSIRTLSATLSLVLIAACEGTSELGLDAGPTDLTPQCQTTILPMPRTLSSTAGAQFVSPRFDPATGRVFALEVKDLRPTDVVVLDDEGLVTERLGLHSSLRTVPLDFALARHAPWIVFSGREGISWRTLEAGPVHVLLPGRLGIEPEFSPDGRRLVFRENTRLYLLELSEHGEAVGEAEEIVLTQSVGAMRPRFSPSGGAIAYFMDGAVEIYDFATKTRRRFVSAIGQAHLAWLGPNHLAIADDRGLFVFRDACLEAKLESGPARYLDVTADGRRLVFAEPGSGVLSLVDGASP
jgi:hypothetical protein